MAAQKVISNVSGVLTEISSVNASAGAGDADELVALNASGVLAATIVNSKTTSAGAGDSGKLPALNASGILDSTIINSKTTSAGAGDSGKVVALDSSGRIDTTMMPVGIAADTSSITTSEALSAGDLVNVWNSTGAKVRKADATTAGKEAHGFVLSASGSGASATVYFEGSNTGISGATPGLLYLSTTAGGFSSTAPSRSGNVVQRVGFATSATAMNFQSNVPITLA